MQRITRHPIKVAREGRAWTSARGWLERRVRHKRTGQLYLIARKAASVVWYALTEDEALGLYEQAMAAKRRRREEGAHAHG